MVGIGNKVGVLEKRVSGAGSRIGAATGKLSAGFQKMGPVAQGASMMGGAAMMAFAGKSVQASAEVDKGIHQIMTLMDEGGMSVDKLKERVMDMSVKYGQSADVMSKSMYDVVSAGYKGEDAFKVLETAAKGAAAGNTDVATSGDALTSMLNAYGKSADEVESVNDKLFKTIKLGKTTMGELGGSIGRVASTAASMGVSMEEMLGPIADLTAKGFSTEEAITSVNQAMIGMVAPTAGAAKAAKDLGLEFTDTNGKLRPMADIMADIASKELTPAQMQLIFPNIRASKAVIALSQSHEKLGKSIEEIANSAGAGSEAFSVMEKNSAFMLEKARAEFFRTMKELGDALIPVIAAILPIFTAMLHLFNKMPKPIRMVVGVIGVLVGALAMFAPIIGALVPLLTGGALSGAIASLGTVFMAFLGPVGLVIIAIGLLVAAFAFDWGGIRTKTVAGMKKIFSAITHPIETLKAIIAKFGDYFLLLLGPIGAVILAVKHWDKIKKIITDVGVAIKDKFLGGLKVVKEKLGPLSEDVRATLAEKWTQGAEAAKTAIQSIGDRLGIDTASWQGTIDSATGVIHALLEGRFKDAALGVFETLGSLRESVFNTFGQLAPGAAERLGDFKELILTKIGDVKVFFGELIPKFLTWARSMMDNLILGIKEKIEQPKKIIREKISLAVIWLKNLPKLLRKVGEQTIQGFIDGIKAKIGAVGNAIKGVAQKIRDYLPFSPAKEGPLSDEPDWEDYLELPSEIDMPEIQAPEIQGVFNAEDCVVDPDCLDQMRTDLADEKPFEVPVEAAVPDITDIENVIVPTVAAGKATEILVDKLQELSDISGISTEKLKKGMVDLSSSGRDGYESLKILKQAALATKEANGDFDTSVNTINASLKTYDRTVEDAAAVNFKLISAANRSEVSLDTLSVAFDRLMPVAEATGMTFDETLGALETLTKQGRPARGSANLLAAAMEGIANPSEEAIKAADELGISFTDASGNIKDLTEIIDDLKSKKLDKEQLKTLFPDKGVAEGIKILVDSHDDLVSTIGTVGKSADFASKGFKTLAEAEESAIKKTEDTETAFEKFAKNVKGPLVSVASRLMDLPAPLMLLLGPIGHVTAAFKTLTDVIADPGDIKDQVIEKLSGAVSFARALITGDTEEIKTALSQKLESGTERAKEAIRSLGSVIATDTSKWEAAVDNSTSAINLMMEGRFKEGASKAIIAFKGLASAVFNTLTQVIVNLGSRLPLIGDSFEEEFNKVVEWLSALPKKFEKAGKNIVTGLVKGITSKVPLLDKVAEALAGAISDYFPFSPAKEGPLAKDPDWESYFKMPAAIKMPDIQLPRGAGPLIIDKCVIAKDALGEAWNAISGKVGEIIGDIKWLGNIAEDIGESMGSALETSFSDGAIGAKAGINTIKDRITEGANGWIETITVAGSSIENIVYSKLIGAADSAKAAFIGTGDAILSGLIGIKEGVIGASDSFKEFTGAAILGVQSVTNSISTHTKRWVSSVIGSTAAIVQNIGISFFKVASLGISYLRQLKTIGVSLFGSLRSEAMSIIGGLSNDLVNAIINGINGLLALKSRFYDAGRTLVKSMIDGLNSLKASLASTVKNLASSVDAYLPHSAAKLGPLSKLPDWSAFLAIPKVSVDTSGISKALAGVGGAAGDAMSIHIDTVTLGEGYGFDDFMRDMEIKKKQRG
jgi:TP901 family phage tail tape measure protein